MAKKSFRLEEEKINRFFKGKSSKQEAREVLNWIYSQKSESEVNDLIKSYWHDAATEDTIWNANASWQEFKHKIQNHIHLKDEKLYDELKAYRDQKSKSSRKRWIYKIAASISFLVLISLALYQMVNVFSDQEVSQASSIENLSKSTSKGQKLTIFLRDGTKVILNAESEINYPEFFNEADRTVELKGEAFFEVTKDENKPFKVLCNQTITEVIGTSFNIKSNPEKQQVNIALVTGKVKVNVFDEQKTTANSVELNPGEAACVDRDLVKIDAFDYNRVILWKEGILFFEKAGINEIINELQRWYGVDIEIQGRDKLERKHYSGKFDNESLQNVLESIGFSKDFNYEITGKKVIITIK